KYKKLIELIENNGLEIQSKKCYDPQSAWHGEELWIVDKKKQNKIFDLSGNGYCFHDAKVEEAIEEVEKYWVVGIFVVNIYYYGRNQRNN
ncbi:hypothetical protein, partial [Streptococcus pneumoniae]|uniref:hypothetical protein n=1 Tax=Streptococcus pneumoniae TaxID=1313 RepID=UPI000B224FE1